MTTEADARAVRERLIAKSLGSALLAAFDGFNERGEDRRTRAFQYRRWLHAVADMHVGEPGRPVSPDFTRRCTERMSARWLLAEVLADDAREPWITM